MSTQLIGKQTWMKCVIIGNEEVGKTSIYLALAINFSPPGIIQAQDGDYSINMMIEGRPVCLGLWDTADDDDDEDRKLNYQCTDVLLLTFSLVDPESFSNIVSKWDPEVGQYCPGVSKILVGNKMDLRDDNNTVSRLKERGYAPISYPQDNEVYIEEGSSLIISEDFDPPQQAISFLAQQTSEIDIQDDEDESDYQYLIEKMTFTPEALNEYDSQCVTQQKSNVRSRKICRICSKSVFDLRRHLEQCHKELDHLQVVKIVAESKRFRKDLKKKPTKAIRNVLLCPYSNEKGEICGRPIVEYKLYQHLKFYHDIHPKSAEGIRLVKQARANPFAVKSVFPDSSENRLDFINDSTSGYSTSNFIPDYESDHAEYCISFPNEENSSNLPIYSETNNAQSQILTHSVPHSIMTPQTYSSLMQPQSSLSPPGISCCVVSICLNIAIAPLETQDL